MQNVLQARCRFLVWSYFGHIWRRFVSFILTTPLFTSRICSFTSFIRYFSKERVQLRGSSRQTGGSKQPSTVSLIKTAKALFVCLHSAAPPSILTVCIYGVMDQIFFICKFSRRGNWPTVNQKWWADTLLKKYKLRNFQVAWFKHTPYSYSIIILFYSRLSLLLLLLHFVYRSLERAKFVISWTDT